MSYEPYSPYGRYTEIPQAQPLEAEALSSEPAEQTESHAEQAPQPAAPEQPPVAQAVSAEAAEPTAPAGPEEPTPEEPKKKHNKRKGLLIAVIIAASVIWTAAAAATVFTCVKLFGTMPEVQQPTVSFSGEIPSVFYDGGTDSDTQEYDDFYDYFEANYSTAASNTMATAELGTGVTVEFEDADASGEMLTYQEIYSEVSPAIVGITTYQNDEAYSWGSGILMTEDGYILTNAHIISECDRSVISLSDGTEYEALLVGMDEDSDIAVLKVDAEGLPYARFGDSDAVQVGDEVVSIGNPLGAEYAGTMTNGIISGINRSITSGGYTMTLLQTNAALNEGNSGGALINMYGQVIGITNMKLMYSNYTTVEGVGFAIPTSVVKDIADQLIAQGYVSGKPGIGIIAAAVNSEAQSAYNLPVGVYVYDIREGSDALNRNIQVGDVITAVNGTPVSTVNAINEIKNQCKVGDTLILTIYRDGETFDEELTLVDASTIDYD